ncbi:MAG: hypothetical protein ACRDJ9_14080 [Dehalococcoidia bacterium]
MSALAILALVLGWVAGQRYERAARAWRDYGARKAELPILRAAARLLTAKAAGAVALAVAFAGFALYVLAGES